MLDTPERLSSILDKITAIDRIESNRGHYYNSGTMKQNNYCQSFGMQISKDPQGGGTNADGSKNKKYCSYWICNWYADYLYPND